MFIKSLQKQLALSLALGKHRRGTRFGASVKGVSNLVWGIRAMRKVKQNARQQSVKCEPFAWTRRETPNSEKGQS